MRRSNLSLRLAIKTKYTFDKYPIRIYNTQVRDNQTVAWAQAYEESPSTTEQECRLTACEGDFKESATEIYRKGNFVRVEMQGKSLHTFW